MLSISKEKKNQQTAIEAKSEKSYNLNGLKYSKGFYLNSVQILPHGQMLFCKRDLLFHGHINPGRTLKTITEREDKKIVPLALPSP